MNNHFIGFVYSSHYIVVWDLCVYSHCKHVTLFGGATDNLLVEQHESQLEGISRQLQVVGTVCTSLKC
jgi:hypothetical protein